MREYKFKGKDIKTKQWVKGDLRQVEGHTYIMDYDIGDNGVSDISRIFDIAYEVDPATVGQYTGLKDKNGKEIYEGDIYHQGDKNILYVVVWHDTSFIGKQLKSSSYAGLTYWLDRIEVIGNIHDNPDLLQK